MGRPSKALSALAIVRRTGLGNRLEDPRVRALTKRFRAIQKSVFQTLVTKTIELGRILIRGREFLKGSYTRWTDSLRIEETTARNYVRLARLAADSPRLIARWKELGPSKLYQIARIPADRRDQAVRAAARMKAPEFIRSVSSQRVRQRKVTGNMTAHGLHNKVKALADFLETLELPRITREEVRRRLASQLRRACDLICALARRVRKTRGRT